ncbi:hypothetical protein BH24ACT5_BH24ACT5_10770 [soil metagenome]
MNTESGDADEVRTVVVRLWLPDRPGALGLVASRVGAVGCDVFAIDILERGAGQVIDELVVSLPHASPDDLLAREIGAVDGVAVEHIRTLPGDRVDQELAMFELCALVAEADQADAVDVLCDGLRVALDADWAVVTAPGTTPSREWRAGSPPDPAWLAAFLAGSDHLDDESQHLGPADVLWARLPTAALVVAVGCARAAHDRERSRLRLLARTVDRLLATRS